jgi:hypothetical protein
MGGPSAIRHDKSWLHKWLGPNQGTHWSVAGAVAVIMIGSYLVYSHNSDNNRTPASPISAAEPSAAPMASAPGAPLNPQK